MQSSYLCKKIRKKKKKVVCFKKKKKKKKKKKRRKASHLLNVTHFDIFISFVFWRINHSWLFNTKPKYMICKHILLMHTVKGSNSSISNDSIQSKSTKLNGPKYCYVLLII